MTTRINGVAIKAGSFFDELEMPIPLSSYARIAMLCRLLTALWMTCVTLSAIDIRLTHNTNSISSSWLADPDIARANEAARYVESIIYGYDDSSIDDENVIEVEMIYLQQGNNQFYASAGGIQWETSTNGTRYSVRGNIQINIDQNVVTGMHVHEMIHILGFGGAEFNRRGLLSLLGDAFQPDAIRYIGEHGVAGFHEEYTMGFGGTNFADFTDPATGKLYLNMVSSGNDPGSHWETRHLSVSGFGSVIYRKAGVTYPWNRSLMQASYDIGESNPQLNKAELGVMRDLGFTLIEDNDADGLVDAWELDLFGSLDATTGSADSDGDGQSNASEYTAKTNPLNAADRLAVTSLSSRGDGTFDIAWRAKLGCTYVIRVSPDLVTWYDYIRDIEAVDGAMTRSVQNVFFQDSDQLFFRVEVQ